MEEEREEDFVVMQMGRREEKKSCLSHMDKLKKKLNKQANN